MKPSEKSKQAYEAGIRAARDGKLITDNPYMYATRKNIGLSSWWEAGFNYEKNKTN